MSDAWISLIQNVLRGDGIFETFRTYGNRRFFKIEDHLDRLFSSAEKMEIDINYTREEILAMLEKISRESPHELQRIKIAAYPGLLIIISEEFIENKEIYNGVKCISVVCQRFMPEIKSTSYMPSMWSHKQAEKAGCFEAILVDDEGEVFEGAFSNIFWFEGDTLCTRKDKVLPGIMRKAILEISPFKVEFKIINIQDLYNMREVFLTLSVRGIVSIVGIDGKQIGSGAPGCNTTKLSSALDSHLPNTIATA